MFSTEKYIFNRHLGACVELRKLRLREVFEKHKITSTSLGWEKNPGVLESLSESYLIFFKEVLVEIWIFVYYMAQVVSYFTHFTHISLNISGVCVDTFNTYPRYLSFFFVHICPISFQTFLRFLSTKIWVLKFFSDLLFILSIDASVKLCISWNNLL